VEQAHLVKVSLVGQMAIHQAHFLQAVAVVQVL
jgi:hypothetical protein